MKKRRGNIQKSKKDRKQGVISIRQKPVIPACVSAADVIQ